jgi:alpha-glucosidase (family GH31 glycosyl hydrolase)
MPICSPLWWLAPEDENTFDVNDQFCLGNDIVVAPVVYDKQRKRDIYLPKGEWKEFEGTKTFDFSKGGQWIRNYEAWIHDIPAFKRVV